MQIGPVGTDLVRSWQAVTDKVGQDLRRRGIAVREHHDGVAGVGKSAEVAVHARRSAAVAKKRASLGCRTPEVVPGDQPGRGERAGRQAIEPWLAQQSML